MDIYIWIYIYIYIWVYYYYDINGDSTDINDGSRIMHISVIVLERYGLFSTEAGDRARWSVYIDDGSGGLKLVTRSPSEPDFAQQFCGVIEAVYSCLSVWQSFAKAFWALTLFFYLNIVAVDGHRLPKGFQVCLKSDAVDPGRLTGLRKKMSAAFATCNAVLVRYNSNYHYLKSRKYIFVI